MFKIIRKFTKIALIPVLCLTFLLTGCGKSIEPTDAALSLFDLYQKGEITENVGISKSEAEKLISDNMKLTLDYLEKEYENYEGKVSREDLTILANKIYDSSKKITVNAKEVSKDGDTSIIKLTSKPIDGTKYDKFTEEKWNSVSEDKFEDAVTNLNIEKETYDEIIKNPIYCDKEESIEIKLTKQDNYWIIESQKDLKKFDKLSLKE